jgi:hypothetical protein
MKLLGTISVDFDLTYQLLIIFSAFVRYWKRSGSTMGQYISYLHISRKPMREVLYNILTEIGIPVK